jgi:ankyrin repeat protein
VAELAASGHAAARNADGVSALMLARYHGRHDLVAAIREHAGELDVFEAATLGDLGRLRTLLDEDAARARERSPDGFTALHFAAFFGTPEAVSLMLERGADPAAVSENAMRVMPLHSAAAARSFEASRMLLDAGAPVDAKQQDGFTPLLAAAHAGDVPLARLFLERGADLDLAGDDGVAPRTLLAASDDAELRALAV